MMMYLAIASLSIMCITQSFKLFMLSRFDLSLSVRENISTLNRYALFIKWEKMGGIIVASILCLLIILVMLSFKQHIESWRWAGVICAMIITPVLTVWQYRKVYGANIAAIRRSLDELRELKEE
jgi:hypothetical protein